MAIVPARLPRAVVALLVGGALGISGAALQGLFRNPLADPGVLGVSSGASLGAVLAIALGLAGITVWALPAGAFAGAAADALLVFAIAARRGRGRLFSGTLLLVGVALGALERIDVDVRALGDAGALRRRPPDRLLAAGGAGGAHRGLRASGRPPSWRGRQPLRRTRASWMR